MQDTQNHEKVSGSTYLFSLKDDPVQLLRDIGSDCELKQKLFHIAWPMLGERGS